MDGDRSRIRLFVVLAQIGVKRFRAGLSQQVFQHHVLAAAFRKMFAVGFTQRANARIAVLLVDATGGVAMPPVQTLLGHLTLPKYCQTIIKRAKAIMLTRERVEAATVCLNATASTTSVEAG